jgi:hypothetical protein
MQEPDQHQSGARLVDRALQEMKCHLHLCWLGFVLLSMGLPQARRFYIQCGKDRNKRVVDEACTYRAEACGRLWIPVHAQVHRGLHHEMCLLQRH